MIAYHRYIHFILIKTKKKEREKVNGQEQGTRNIEEKNKQKINTKEFKKKKSLSVLHQIFFWVGCCSSNNKTVLIGLRKITLFFFTSWTTFFSFVQS